MPSGKPQMSGRILKAPEGELSAAQAREAHKGRRTFMGNALAMGVGAAGVASAASSTSARAAADTGAGDPAILRLPAHSTGLGQPVAVTGYGLPSRWEQNIQRRPSP